MKPPSARRRVSPMRTFDPVRLGLDEADAWVAYYRREWAPFPVNDAAGAQAYMRRFYALVKRHHLELIRGYAPLRRAVDTVAT